MKLFINLVKLIYTFGDHTTFKISQILLAIPLPVPLVLAVVTLRIFSWATLGLYLRFCLTTALGISAFALLLETGSVTTGNPIYCNNIYCYDQIPLQ